jgi:putative NADH-flavin reductase
MLDWPRKLLREKKRFAFIQPSPSLTPPRVAAQRFTCFIPLAIDSLIVDDKQQSRIWFEDFAIALVDEPEMPKHERQHFTVGC